MTAQQSTGQHSGWVSFAVAMFFVLGAFNIINGIAVLANSEWVVFSQEGAWLFDFAVWGWVTLILGGVETLVGWGLLVGSEAARVTGIFMAVIAAVNAIFIIPIYPIWGILTFALTIPIIHALTAGKSAI